MDASLRSLVAAAVCVAVFASPALAAEPGAPASGPAQQAGGLGENPTLSDYLEYAGEHNPGLAAAERRWKAALEQVPQARSLPDPRLTYRYYIREVETRVGAQQQGLGIAQMLPWPGKLDLRGGAAMAAAAAEAHRYRAAQLQVAYEVQSAYHEYAFLARAVAIARENVKLLGHVESVARARYAASLGHPDVIRAQVEIGRLDERVRSLADMRDPLAERLSAALGRPESAALPWPAPAQPQLVAFTDEQVLAWADEGNPELAALDSEAARSEIAVELARKEYYPDVTVGVDWIDTARSTGGRHPDGDGKDPVVAMVSVNLPIWRDKLASGVRQARYRHLAAVDHRAHAANALRARLKAALYHFRDAERKLDLYRDTLVPKADEAIKAAEAAFRAGTGGFTDLLDSQRTLLDFELSAERAGADRAISLAELEMLVGRAIVGPADSAAPPEPPQAAP